MPTTGSREPAMSRMPCRSCLRFSILMERLVCIDGPTCRLEGSNHPCLAFIPDPLDPSADVLVLLPGKGFQEPGVGPGASRFHLSLLRQRLKCTGDAGEERAVIGLR